MPRTTLPGLKCARCGHEWHPMRVDDLPGTCPKCRSALWDRPRKPKP